MSLTQPRQVSPLRPQLSHTAWQTGWTDKAEEGCLLKVPQTCCKALLRSHSTRTGSSFSLVASEVFPGKLGCGWGRCPFVEGVLGAEEECSHLKSQWLGYKLLLSSALGSPQPQAVPTAGKQWRMCPTLSPFQFIVCCHSQSHPSPWVKPKQQHMDWSWRDVDPHFPSP